MRYWCIGVLVCWLHVRGENGAGKTSLLRLLAGLSQPAEGEIRWCGQSIRDSDSPYRQNLLYFGHHGALKEDLTAMENLGFSAAMDGIAYRDGEALAALTFWALASKVTCRASLVFVVPFCARSLTWWRRSTVWV